MRASLPVARVARLSWWRRLALWLTATPQPTPLCAVCGNVRDVSCLRGNHGHVCEQSGATANECRLLYVRLS